MGSNPITRSNLIKGFLFRKSFFCYTGDGLLRNPFLLRRFRIKKCSITSLRSSAYFRLPEPCFRTTFSRVQTPAFSRIYTKTPHKAGFRCKWRIDRDSNPGYPLEVYTISNRAPSTTRPSIHFISFINLIKYILFCNKFFIFFIMWL